jgi:hypothetical protein
MAIVRQEPRRKGKGGAREAVAFREAVRQRVASNPRWPRPQAQLAVDLHFSTTRRQPPKLWTLPKHYLDLLGQTGAPADDPGSVLYRDDRNIKMLYASCVHRWDPDMTPNPVIVVTARTRADALADMALAWRISQADNGSHLGWGIEDDLAADLALEGDREELSTADRLDEGGDEESHRAAELLRHHVRQRRQDQYLHGNDGWLRTVFFRDGYPLLYGTDPRERRLATSTAQAGLTTPTNVDYRASADYRRLMLSGLNRIDLPPLPAKPGDSAVFRAEVVRLCREFVDRNPGLFPLLVPLRVTVLLVPPRRSTANVKDLDNVTLDVLAAVDKHFRPPANPWLLGPALAEPSDPSQPDGLAHLRAWHRKELARLKSLGETAIWAYQILELQRYEDDPDEGFLIIVPGHGMNHRSLWNEADDYLAEHLDRPGLQGTQVTDTDV